MKTEFRFSAKMHLFIIISALIVAIGLAVGLSCEFAADGYFNYGADWTSYKSVTVRYEYVDFSDESELVSVCEKAFDAAGIRSYASQYGDTSTGGVIVYKFTLSTDDAKLSAACTTIQAAIAERGSEGEALLSGVSVHVDKTVLGGGKALLLCGIGLAAAVAFQFLYFVIRYKVSMALGALLANVHNLALYLSLLAITRIPVGTSMFAFGALTVLFTIVVSCFVFDKMRKNFKDEEFSKLDAFGQVDASAREAFKFNLIFIGSLAAVAALLFVLMSISSLSPLAILSPVLCALVAFVSCAYGTLLFTPAVYSRFKRIGERFQRKKPRVLSKKTQKTAKTAEN